MNKAISYFGNPSKPVHGFLISSWSDCVKSYVHYRTQKNVLGKESFAWKDHHTFNVLLVTRRICINVQILHILDFMTDMPKSFGAITYVLR